MNMSQCCGNSCLIELQIPMECSRFLTNSFIDFWDVKSSSTILTVSIK